MGRTVVVERVQRAYRAFADRAEAGEALVRLIAPDPDERALVLALPRGGVPVALPLASALGAPLHPMPVRKLPVPASPEMGFGAVTLDGTRVLNPRVVAAHAIDEMTVAQVAERVRYEVARRARTYPGGLPFPDVSARDIWLVDDGLATGYTALAAVRMLGARDPASIRLAVPVAQTGSLKLVEKDVTEVYCILAQQSVPFAVAAFYRDFHDLTDDEVIALLVG